MNKIKRALEAQKGERSNYENEAVDFSRKIEAIIEMKAIELPEGFSYKFHKWTICKQSRAYYSGWVDLLEVEKIGEDFVFLKQGTRSISLPPKKTQDAFLDELKKHLAE